MSWQFAQNSDEEGLRLIVAFLQIADPEIRRALIELAERAAQTSRPPTTELSFVRQDNQPS